MESKIFNISIKLNILEDYIYIYLFIYRFVSLEWPTVPDNNVTPSNSLNQDLSSNVSENYEDDMRIKVGDNVFRINGWIYEGNQQVYSDTCITNAGVGSFTRQDKDDIPADTLRRVRLVRISEEKEYRRKNEKMSPFNSSFLFQSSSLSNSPATTPRLSPDNSPPNSLSNTPTSSRANYPALTPMQSLASSHASSSPSSVSSSDSYVDQESNSSKIATQIPKQPRSNSRLGRWSDKLRMSINGQKSVQIQDSNSVVFYESQLVKDLKGFPDCAMPAWFPRLCGRYLRQPEFTITVVGYDQGFPQAVVYGERVNRIADLLKNNHESEFRQSPMNSNASSDSVNNIQWFRYWRTPQLQREHLVQTRRELLQNHRRYLTSMNTQSSIIDNSARRLSKVSPTSNFVRKVLRAFSNEKSYAIRTHATADAEIVTKTTRISPSYIKTDSPLLTDRQLSRIDFSTPKSCMTTLRIPRPPPLPITVCNTPLLAPQQFQRNTTIGRVQCESLRDITIMVDREVVDFDRAPFQRRILPKEDRVADTRILLNAGDVY